MTRRSSDSDDVSTTEGETGRGDTLGLERARRGDIAKAQKAQALMEQYNAEAQHVNVWMRTQRHGPAQRPWFSDPMAPADAVEEPIGKEGANRLKPVPYNWRWNDVAPYVQRMSELAQRVGIQPMQFANRQSIMLLNPALGGRIQVTKTIRAAFSVYNPGDVAPAHMHSANASRTIISEGGGYTTIEGERCDARRGDVILTPNGTWHHHGNDGDAPVVWLDTLDWPLIEYLDCTWLDTDYRDSSGIAAEVPPARHGRFYSSRLYGSGGLRPSFVAHERGLGHRLSPLFHYRGEDIRRTLEGLRDEPGDPYEGIQLELVNPATGESVFPTLSYHVQLLPARMATQPKRETSSCYFVVMEGEGYTEVGGQRFDWVKNDVVCIPGFLWRRHVNTGDSDAILYSVSDAALMRNIGQYRAQGMAGNVVQLVS